MGSKHPFREPLPHERPPPARIYVGGKPSLVLPTGTAREKGKAALIQHLEVISRVEELVRSCLGPNSAYKLIQSENGANFLTNDSFTIFSRTALEHPLAQVVAGAGIDSGKESGGGSTTTIVLTTRILKSILPLAKEGVRQGVLVKGCSRAYEHIRRELDSLTLVPEDPMHLIRPIVRTALCGTVLENSREKFAEMVLEVLSYVGAGLPNESRRLDDIYVRLQIGESLAESRVIRGLALLRERIHPGMKEHLSDGKLLLVRGEFNMPKKGKTQYYDHTFKVNSPEEYAKLLRSKKAVLLDAMGNIPSLGPDVILVEKGVDDSVVDYLATKGAIVIRRFPPQEFDHVISVTGATPVSDFSTVSASDLVNVGKISHEKIGDSSWWFLEGFEAPRSCEVLIRGPDELSLQEAERLLKSCFKLVRLYLNEPKVVYGGGWFEMEVSRGLRESAREIPNKEQLVVEKIADAFESIPSILAESSGLNPLDAVVDLRHYGRGRFMGVDGSRRKIDDMSVQHVVEPIHVKRQSVVSAFEAAITVLRIDQVIRSRKLSKEEKYYLERLEKTTPEATRKIQRDYGI